jgi:hypothetical protein
LSTPMPTIRNGSTDVSVVDLVNIADSLRSKQEGIKREFKRIVILPRTAGEELPVTRADSQPNRHQDVHLTKHFGHEEK